MDALEFAREHDRMCKMYQEPSPDGACDNCPITGKCKCDDWTQVVPIVEKWSKEHPLIRNVDHVAEGLEKLGYKVDVNEMIERNCPPKKSGNYTTMTFRCEGAMSCYECRKWWTEEYKGEDIADEEKTKN